MAPELKSNRWLTREFVMGPAGARAFRRRLSLIERGERLSASYESRRIPTMQSAGTAFTIHFLPEAEPELISMLVEVANLGYSFTGDFTLTLVPGESHRMKRWLRKAKVKLTVEKVDSELTYLHFNDLFETYREAVLYQDSLLRGK